MRMNHINEAVRIRRLIEAIPDPLQIFFGLVLLSSFVAFLRQLLSRRKSRGKMVSLLVELEYKNLTRERIAIVTNNINRFVENPPYQAFKRLYNNNLKAISKKKQKEFSDDFKNRSFSLIFSSFMNMVNPKDVGIMALDNSRAVILFLSDYDVNTGKEKLSNFVNGFFTEDTTSIKSMTVKSHESLEEFESYLKSLRH